MGTEENVPASEWNSAPTPKEESSSSLLITAVELQVHTLIAVGFYFFLGSACLVAPAVRGGEAGSPRTRPARPLHRWAGDIRLPPPTTSLALFNRAPELDVTKYRGRGGQRTERFVFWGHFERFHADYVVS